jgi:hypothetical protein
MFISPNSTLADPSSCMCGKVIGSWLSIQQYTSQMSENDFDIPERRVVYSRMSSFCAVCCLVKQNGSYFLTKNFCSGAPMCWHVSQLWAIIPLVLCCNGTLAMLAVQSVKNLTDFSHALVRATFPLISLQLLDCAENIWWTLKIINPHYLISSVFLFFFDSPPPRGSGPPHSRDF